MQNTRQITWKDIEDIGLASNYLKTLLTKPEIKEWIWDNNNLLRVYALTELYRDIKYQTRIVFSYQELLREFRRFKQRHFLRIAGRDFLKLSGFEETVSQISYLAQVCLQAGIEILKNNPSWWIKKEFREKKDMHPGDSDLTVLGMGKLGGEELNYVSDIDLIYLHGLEYSKLSPNGIQEKKDCLRRFCQYLSNLLHEYQQGDRVFKVDLRLRPKGKDGELIPSVESALKHYQIYGQAWERQALLKAAPVAGNRGLGRSFLQEIHPFVFRRFLDFQSLDEIRQMRDNILKEEQDLYSTGPWDVKLGVGGIREIEFIVQSFQLIYGGRYRELVTSNTLRCLDSLLEMGLMPEDSVLELKQAYVFLRGLEHWLQLEQNRQARKFPASEQDQFKLAWILGYQEDLRAFKEKMELYIAKVHEHFAALFQSSKRQVNNESGEVSSTSRKDAREEEIDERDLFHSSEVAENFNSVVLDAGKEVLNELLRQNIIEDFGSGAARIENFLYRVKTRPGLIKLINSHPDWLKILLRGVVLSEFIAALLSYQPALIEGIPVSGAVLSEGEILSEGTKEISTSRIYSSFESWRPRAKKIISGSNTHEEVFEWIRRLKNERMLVVALAELFGRYSCGAGQEINRKEVERELSHLADFVLEQCFVQVCRMLGEDEDIPLGIFALGKLGSKEMGYLSDLDLMFVYDSGSNGEQDQIPKNIIRLIQRLMRMLSTPLQEGPGYSVDARLRPTGNFGPLVVTRQRWEKYYEQEADIWEIQALLRLRFVAGDKKIGEHIENFVHSICFRSRDPLGIWPGICDMRRRIQEERSREREGEFDIKFGVGGLVELEFLVQGVQLTRGGVYPDIRKKSAEDNLPFVLQILQEEPRQDKLDLLTNMFGLYRVLEHHVQLFTNSSSSRITHVEFEYFLENFSVLFGQENLYPALDSWADLQRLRRQVNAVWSAVCEHYALD